MKKILFTFLIIFTPYSFANVCDVNKNIKDYFLSIPPEMLVIGDDLKGPLVSKQEREAAIDTLDIKNGFISLQNETIISKYEIVLYRAEDKKPVVLVTGDGVSVQNVLMPLIALVVNGMMFPMLFFRKSHPRQSPIFIVQPT